MPRGKSLDEPAEKHVYDVEWLAGLIMMMSLDFEV